MDCFLNCLFFWLKCLRDPLDFVFDEISLVKCVVTFPTNFIFKNLLSSSFLLYLSWLFCYGDLLWNFMKNDKNRNWIIRSAIVYFEIFSYLLNFPHKAEINYEFKSENLIFCFAYLGHISTVEKVIIDLC